MSNAMTADIVVIGGGMVGLASAIALRDRGLDVVLCDPGEARARTSYGNAGVVSRGSILSMASPGLWGKLPAYLRNADPGLRLRHRHLPRVLPWAAHFLAASRESAWRRTAAALAPLTAAAYGEHRRLAERAGTTHLLRHPGWLKLYRTEAALAGSALERDILAENGVPFEIVAGAAVRDLEPALIRPFHGAMLLPETGTIADPGGLVEACEGLFSGLGGRTLRGTVTRLAPAAEGWSVETAGARVAARQVVLAAGAASAEIARPLGYRFAFAAERGYHRHYALRPGSPALNRPVYDTGAGSILSPMGEGRVRVLSGVELDARDAPPDLRQIEAAAREAAGTVRLGAPLDNRPWLGSRPSTPDGLPVIGVAPRHRGLILAFGHGHIGLSTGPITGRLVADLATGREPAVPVAPFAPDRLLGWPRP
ncbi:NAD(P)/FAD-dependent oxidoreductase [Methylobacterium oryzihabitans]|uniref:FAD-binding oxidoreductase n=1 Tax=Methylobacterium oryzihabitans TaxID=2499852 RepID=A0A437PI00_9HYPH|nr:FAD-binding oxidoreductase [Methylobacterium oryzihabitans]RVU21912.1 FAD-binding oxidoreductase [Methylobacterium oryzihabitans]